MDTALRGPAGLALAGIAGLALPLGLGASQNPLQFALLVASAAMLLVAALFALRLARGGGAGLFAGALAASTLLRIAELAVQLGSGFALTTAGSLLLDVALLQATWFALRWAFEEGGQARTAAPMRVSWAVAALSRVWVALLLVGNPPAAIAALGMMGGFYLAASGGAWDGPSAELSSVRRGNAEAAP